MKRSEDMQIGDQIITQGQSWGFEPRTIVDIWPAPDDYYNPEVQCKLILDTGTGIDDWPGKMYATPEDYPWLEKYLQKERLLRQPVRCSRR